MLETESLQAVFLGILQGLTEFLPVSSSAHLIVLPWLLGWEPLGITFDVLVHGGTLLALLIYFRKEWRQLARAPWKSASHTLSAKEPGALWITLVLGTFPAGIVGTLLGSAIERNLRTPFTTVLTLSGFGLLLWWADRRGTQTRQLKHVSLQDGLLVGLAQALALVPGVSRSGVCLTAALMLGFSRADAARFSFLLGTPIIGLATVSGLYEVWQLPDQEALLLAPYVLGVIFSFTSGFVCIKFFLQFLQTRTCLSFVVYRLLLALFIFVLLVW